MLRTHLTELALLDVEDWRLTMAQSPEEVARRHVGDVPLKP
jgi:hypothetical protein